MILDDILNNKIIITLIGTMITLFMTLVKLYKSSIDKKFDSITGNISKQKEYIYKIEKESNKIDRRLLEYQISANATFVMKEDLKDFKYEMRNKK